MDKGTTFNRHHCPALVHASLPPSHRESRGTPPLCSSPCHLLATQGLHLCGVPHSDTAHPTHIPSPDHGPNLLSFQSSAPKLPTVLSASTAFVGLVLKCHPPAGVVPSPAQNPSHPRIPAPDTSQDIPGATLTWPVPPLPGSHSGFLPTSTPRSLKPGSASQYFESPSPQKRSALSPARDEVLRG